MPNRGSHCARRRRVPAGSASVLKRLGQNTVRNDDCRMKDAKLDFLVNGHDLSAISTHDEEGEEHREDTPEMVRCNLMLAAFGQNEIVLYPETTTLGK